MRTRIFTFVFCVGAALPVLRAADAFAGTWVLNPEKSKGITYHSGTRTYTPVDNGTRVNFRMVRDDGSVEEGTYTVRCDGRQCVGDTVRWTQRGPDRVEGEILQGGTVTFAFTRSISAGKLSIRFFDPQTRQPRSEQIWEREPVKRP
jgi:hypothetical protein